VPFTDSVDVAVVERGVVGAIVKSVIHLGSVLECHKPVCGRCSRVQKFDSYIAFFLGVVICVATHNEFLAVEQEVVDAGAGIVEFNRIRGIPGYDRESSEAPAHSEHSVSGSGVVHEAKAWSHSVSACREIKRIGVG